MVELLHRRRRRRHRYRPVFKVVLFGRQSLFEMSPSISSSSILRKASLFVSSSFTSAHCDFALSCTLFPLRFLIWDDGLNVRSNCLTMRKISCLPVKNTKIPPAGNCNEFDYLLCRNLSVIFRGGRFGVMNRHGERPPRNLYHGVWCCGKSAWILSKIGYAQGSTHNDQS